MDSYFSFMYMKYNNYFSNILIEMCFIVFHRSLVIVVNVFVKYKILRTRNCSDTYISDGWNKTDILRLH